MRVLAPRVEWNRTIRIETPPRNTFIAEREVVMHRGIIGRVLVAVGIVVVGVVIIAKGPMGTGPKTKSPALSQGHAVVALPLR